MTRPVPRTQSSFFRPTWADIDPKAFVRNARHLAHVLTPSQKMIVVLKADGYGHGAVALGRAVAAEKTLPLWGFGVSSIEEGLSLRRAGFRERILILGSLYPFDSFAPALRNHLTPTVASLAAAKAVGEAASRLKLKTAVHVKIDTGMSRIGVSPDTAMQTISAVAESEYLTLEGVYTHFAQADDEIEVRKQLALFNVVLNQIKARGLPVMAHAANSLAALKYPEARFDAVRPGIALYGATPDPTMEEPLAPVMTWKTRIVFIKTAKPGTRVSYGGTYVVRRPSRIATLPVGYADGYRRAFSNKGYVLVNQMRCPIMGRVTMDQTMVDVTDVPGADVGDEAVLLGFQGDAEIKAQDLAQWADTISYEIFCGITARVPRVARAAGRAAVKA
jgi:alanine racemase